MGFSPLANMSRRIQPGGRQSPRNSVIKGFTIHHNAGVDAYGQASAAGREVSANYWITNDGVIIPNIDENMRAWTTGAVGYPEGANSDHRNITVEVSNSPEGVRNGSWAISAKAKTALEKLIGDVFKRHNLGTVKRGTWGGVAIHKDFVPTACPGGYIVNNLGSIIANAEKYRKGAGGGSSSGGSDISKKSVSQLATEVIQGKYGNGEARKKALGSRYAEVQKEVDKRMAASKKPAPAVNIEQLARDVIAGKYGNGQDRKNRLGANYAAVQARVDQILSGQNKPAAVNIDALARAVIRGDYGNGAERQRRLGSNYNAVQKRVNQILGIG